MVDFLDNYHNVPMHAGCKSLERTIPERALHQSESVYLVQRRYYKRDTRYGYSDLANAVTVEFENVAG